VTLEGFYRRIRMRTRGEAGEEEIGVRVQGFGDGGNGLADVDDPPLGRGETLQSKTGLLAIHEEH